MSLMSPRKDTNKVDNPTFKRLAAEARGRVPSKLVEVCAALSRRAESVARARVPRHQALSIDEENWVLETLQA